MPSNPLLSRKMLFILAAFGVLIVAALVLQHFTAARGVKGTITYLDPVQRIAAIETIDPATGATREFRGVAAADCVITINGRPAQLAELRVGDTARIKVRVERQSPDSKDQQNGGSRRKTNPVLIGERIEVTRPQEGTP